MWRPAPSDEYKRRQNRLEKRYSRELQGCAANAQRYLEALRQGTKPKQIQAGWIHHEPHDIVAVDQRGGGKKDGGKNKGKGLVEMRLYLFANVASEVLHFITLGLKDTQGEDILFSVSYVQNIQHHEGEEHEDIPERGGSGP